MIKSVKDFVLCVSRHSSIQAEGEAVNEGDFDSGPFPSALEGAERIVGMVRRTANTGHRCVVCTCIFYSSTGSKQGVLVCDPERL